MTVFTLSDILPLVSDKDKQMLTNFFKNAPKYITDHSVIKNLEFGQTLISAGQKADTVYFHITGRLQGVDVFKPDVIYNFIELLPINTIGEFEALTNKDNYQINVIAKSKSTLIAIKVKDFLSWMQTDIEALNILCRLLAFKLTHESKINREYLFLSSYERILLYLYNYAIRPTSGNPIISIYKKHTEIADETGFSEKTICRIVSKLVREGFISSGRNIIKISSEQFLLIKKTLEELSLI